MRNLLSLLDQSPHLTRQAARDYLLITLGAFLQALAIRLFLVPAGLVNGGIAGLAQIINHYTGLPIGVMMLAGNLPLFLLGWRHLGGRRFALRTAYAVVVIAILTDTLVWFLPKNGLTPDLFLNALYGGVTSGIGYGLVYRGQGTSGGTDILAKVLNNWRGLSISQSYLLTDALIMLLGGLVYSWENALYAVAMLYISGITVEVALEGSNVVRTAMIITTQPELVMQQILECMQRGVTSLKGTGGYTGQEKAVLYCVITRAEVSQLKALVQESDPQAFMVIGQAHEALGEGFHPLTAPHAQP